MALLGRELLDADDIKTRIVPVPEWGGEVLVRSMSASEYEAFQDKIEDPNAQARLCACVMVDDQGKRLFSETDVQALMKKSTKALERVAVVAASMNVLTKEAREGIAKNSESGQPGDSP